MYRQQSSSNMWFQQCQGSKFTELQLEIFGSTVDVLCSILEISWIIVPEEAFPPNGPCLSISEFGDRAVKKGDWSATVIVL